MVTLNDYNYDTLTPGEIFVHPKWETFRDKAEEILVGYNRQLCGTLDQYGIEKESELMSGCIERMAKLTQRINETYDAKILIGLKIKDLHQRTRLEFCKEFGGENTLHEGFTNDMMRKASALYNVTYMQETPVLLSCPWILADILCDVAKSKGSVPVRTLQRFSIEPRVYTEYARAELSFLKLSDDQEGAFRNIEEYFTENSWLQLHTGVLLTWRNKNDLTRVISTLDRPPPNSI